MPPWRDSPSTAVRNVFMSSSSGHRVISTSSPNHVISSSAHQISSSAQHQLISSSAHHPYQVASSGFFTSSSIITAANTAHTDHQLIRSSTYQLISSSAHQVISSSAPSHQLIGSSSAHQLISSSTHQRLIHHQLTSVPDTSAGCLGAWCSSTRLPINNTQHNTPTQHNTTHHNTTSVTMATTCYISQAPKLHGLF